MAKASEGTAVDKAAQRKLDRQKEIETCQTQLGVLLNQFDATLQVARIVTVGNDGIERSSFQVTVISK